MVCAGLLVLAVFPAAYVELPTPQLVSKSPGHQLRVYTAGVWHNTVMALAAWSLALATPTLLHPLYVTGRISIFFKMFLIMFSNVLRVWDRGGGCHT